MYVHSPVCKQGSLGGVATVIALLHVNTIHASLELHEDTNIQPTDACKCDPLSENSPFCLGLKFLLIVYYLEVSACNCLKLANNPEA